MHAAWSPDGSKFRAGAERGCDHRAIGTVYDPEIPVNIYELGLIYAIEIADHDGTR